MPYTEEQLYAQITEEWKSDTHLSTRENQNLIQNNHNQNKIILWKPRLRIWEKPECPYRTQVSEKANMAYEREKIEESFVSVCA